MGIKPQEGTPLPHLPPSLLLFNLFSSSFFSTFFHVSEECTQNINPYQTEVEYKHCSVSLPLLPSTRLMCSLALLNTK